MLYLSAFAHFNRSHFANFIAETLKFWFDSIHFYGSSDNDKHEDIKHINRPELSSGIEMENAYTRNASTLLYDRHNTPGSEGHSTFQKYLEPPIVAIGTHKDQCMVIFITYFSSSQTK